MPDIEVYGPVSLNDITGALRGAYYADKLSFVRQSKNVTDINGKAQSFVRITATANFPRTDLDDLVDRLKLVVGVETAGLHDWIPQEPKPQPQEAQP